MTERSFGRSSQAKALALAAGASLLPFIAAGCRGSSAYSGRPEPVTLRVGYGLAAGVSPETGIRQLARFISLEPLVVVGADGRSHPRVAESWQVSDDGLTWRIRVRDGARFHTGRAVDAVIVRQILQKQLPAAMGPAFEDVADIRVASNRDVEVRLTRRSAFLLESLDLITFEEPGSPLSGAGPFHVNSEQGNEIDMARNDGYYAGPPAIAKIAIKPYTSIRSAWADMLRGRVDMLYDVPVDALDSMTSSQGVKVFSFRLGFAYLLVLNVQRPALKDAAFRRSLNAAIDREALISDALRGHGVPARGPVFPSNWSFSPDLPQFRYQPEGAARPSKSTFKILFDEPALERIALLVQRQLQAIGVETEFEFVSQQQFAPRIFAGDFDAVLTDYNQGPNLARPYLYWRTGAPYNFGHYSNPRVDAALDTIRHAADEQMYKSGVAEFQRAIVDDPPAVFLAWRDRARAVSTRFQVPSDADGEVLRTLHRWQPTTTTEPLLARRSEMNP